MLTLEKIAFNNLPTENVKSCFIRNISPLDMGMFQKVVSMIEIKNGGECGNCTPLRQYNLVCRNCLIFGHTTMRPESNMLQVYIDYDVIEQTEFMLMKEEIDLYRRELEDIYEENSHIMAEEYTDF